MTEIEFEKRFIFKRAERKMALGAAGDGNVCETVDPWSCLRIEHLTELIIERNWKSENFIADALSSPSTKCSYKKITFNKPSDKP